MVSASEKVGFMAGYVDGAALVRPGSPFIYLRSSSTSFLDGMQVKLEHCYPVRTQS